MSLFRRLATVPAGRRAKWVLLVVWIGIAVVAGPLASKLNGIEKNDAAAYLPGKAESTRALDLQKKFQAEDTLLAIVVYQRSDGITPADTARAKANLATILDQPFIDRSASAAPGGNRAFYGPIPSRDGKALELIVPVKASNGLPLDKYVDKLRSITHGSEGLQVHVAGPAGSQADSLKAFLGIDTTLLLFAGIVVIVILLIVYRSPVLWLVPVVSAGISVVLAQAVNYLLAKHAGLTVNGQSAGILSVLVFGAGTDYALLIVSRYREELHNHEDKHEAMAFALRRTSPAIVASAGTVIISLLCLLVSELNSNRGLGVVCSVGIACAFLAMSTFLPALLVIGGRRIFWPLVPRYGVPSHQDTGVWSRIGRGVGRRPRIIWVGTAVALGVLCLGLVSLDTGGLSNAGQFRSTPDSVAGARVIDAHFPAGGGNPIVVIGRTAGASGLPAAIRSTDGVAAVAPPRQAGGYAEIQATLSGAPDSQSAFDTIRRLRTAVHAVPGADAVVGGTTAINLDVEDSARHDRDLVIPIVLGVVFVVLALLLRAIVVPLLLMATVVLSFAAALGIAGFFFAHVFHFDGADAGFPLFVFIFLVALGIDYNIFLMTRVREETLTRGTRRGTIRGLTVTGGVITSAGVVLAATFSVLCVLPLVQLIEVGFAVAVGVLLDTFVVRSVLVPALSVDIGRRIWWPSHLARADVDAAADRDTDEVAAAPVP